jgi:hypothetical protein
VSRSLSCFQALTLRLEGTAILVPRYVHFRSHPGQSTCPEYCVGRRTVSRHLKQTQLPFPMMMATQDHLVENLQSDGGARAVLFNQVACEFLRIGSECARQQLESPRIDVEEQPRIHIVKSSCAP